MPLRLSLTHTGHATIRHSITSSARPRNMSGKGEAERLGSYQVHHKIKLGRLIDWMSPGLAARPLQNRKIRPTSQAAIAQPAPVKKPTQNQTPIW
jgi:hypothetical protein